MSQDPTKTAPGSTSGSKDVAGGGVAASTGTSTTAPAAATAMASADEGVGSASSKKKKKKKKAQQQRQREEEEDKLKQAEEVDEDAAEDDDEEDVSAEVVAGVITEKQANAPETVLETEPAVSTAQPVELVAPPITEPLAVASSVPETASSAAELTAEPLSTASLANEDVKEMTKESLPAEEPELFSGPVDGDAEADDLFGKADEQEDIFARAGPQNEPLTDEVRLEEPVQEVDEEVAVPVESAAQDAEVIQEVAQASREFHAEKSHLEHAGEDSSSLQVQDSNQASRETGLFDGPDDVTDDLFGSQPAATDPFNSLIGQTTAPAVETESATPVQAEEESLFSSTSPSAEVDLFGAPPVSEPFDLELSTTETVKPLESAGEDRDDDLFGGEEEVADDLFGEGDKRDEQLQTHVQPVGPETAREPSVKGPRSPDTNAVYLDSPTDDPFGGPDDQADDDFFSAAVKPVQPEASTIEADKLDRKPSRRSRASTKTSDLFQGDDSGDLFADLGQPAGATETVEEKQDQDLFDGEADDDLFGQGQVENTPDWAQQNSQPPTPVAPIETEVDAATYDSAELDLMGVPEGWMDGGVWCWYTEDERNEVAKQMIAEGTAEAPEKESTAAVRNEPVAPVQDNAPAVKPYAPAPAQIYSPAQTYSPANTYSPTQATSSAVAAAMPYVPSSSISRYGSPAIQSYAPSPSAPSPYTPSPYTPAAPNNFQNPDPYNNPSAALKHVVSPPATLQRTRTTTAYDPPVPASRNLSRPPSVAPVFTQYAPLAYAPGPAHTPASPPPPPPAGPLRSSGPARTANSVKSALAGRSTPTAYDPPVPSISRQPSYARLKPAPEVAPPMPPLPQTIPQPVANLAPAAPPPPSGPPKGPSRSASFIQPPPQAGAYRPPSRARVETSDSMGMGSLRQAAPPVPPLPRNIPAAIASPYGSPVPPVQDTSSPQPAAVNNHDSDISGYQSRQPTAATSAGSLPPPPLAKQAAGSTTFSPPPMAPSPDFLAPEPAARDVQMTPQRGDPAQLPPNDEWPNNVSPAKPRPLLREDTFQPPAPFSDEMSYPDPDPEDGPLDVEDAGVSGEEPRDVIEDPYKPVSASYLPAPAPPVSQDYRPYDAQTAATPYDPYQPKAQDNSDATTVPSASKMLGIQSDDYGSPALQHESPAMSGSAYEPTPENAPKPLSEDILERASPSAHRVPCVSFGPQGQCVIVFQSEPTGNGFETGQRLLPAYGDRSQEQKVQLHQIKDVIPEEGISATTADWPGPLFVDAAASKVTAASKKKRDAVNAYIDARVQEIRSGLVYLTASKKDENSRNKAEARMLLLEIVKLMIAADGKSLQSDTSSRTDLVDLLSSHVSGLEGDVALRQRTKITEPVGTAADLDHLSRMLVKGQQQEAQQYAIQQQLWSHALLISSVMGPQSWQSCVDSFIAQTAASNDLAQPLVTAYKMFGGTQQLAPSSGKAGSWRDSIATVVANAKASDGETLVKLADQLKSDLVEASHICYLLSSKLNEWAVGFDTSRLALFGCREVTSTGRDLEISELIEYALSFRPTAKGVEPYHGVARLLAYKLQKALEYYTSGRASEARAYCDAVLSQSRSYKSPNPAIITVARYAETLSGRIAGIAVTEAVPRKGGKPNLENLGSWFEGRLTKFIAGDEEPENKPAQTSALKESSDKAAIGPFSHYSAISSPNVTPNLTRSSTYDLSGQHAPPPGPHAYRSGSAASYRPRQPSQLSMQRPTSAMAYRPQDQPAFPEMTRISSRITEQDGVDSRRDSGPDDTIAANSTMVPEQQPAEAQFQMPSWGQSYDEPEQIDGNPEGSGDADPDTEGAFINPMQTFISPMGPAVSSYEPNAAAQVASRPAFDDEDDDDLGLGNASRKKPSTIDDSKVGTSKASAAASSFDPASAKEAIVKPEPAKPANPPDSGKGSQSGSWLGKWWGKKEETAGPGPVKAKLGDESAFYYDKEQKRWINKTAGATEAPKAAPPPPPAARSSPAPAGNTPTPRAVGSTATPPPAPSRGPSIPPANGTAPPTRPPSASAPPGPRGMPPAGGARTPMNAADPPLADPLAAPLVRKGAAKGKKDLRAKYVNVL